MTTTQDRIQGLIGDLGVKPPVRVATTAAITLSGEQTIDGVAVVAEDRVLVKDQSDTTTNGIYYCQASTWVRAPDFDGTRDALQGTLVVVAVGTANAGTIWRLTTASPVIGTSNLTFSLFPISASAFVQTLLDDSTAGAFLTTLGVSAFIQTLLNDADAATALSTLGVSSFAQTLLDDLNAAAARATLDAASVSATENITGVKTFTNGANILGQTGSATIAAGYVGENLDISLASGSAVSLVANTTKTVISRLLSKGKWDISGVVNFTFGATTQVSSLFGSSSLTNNTADSYQFNHRCAAFTPGAVDMGYTIPPREIDVDVPTTVYLVATAGFTTSTCAAWGQMRIRRIA
jgi:hypothetical protein